MDSYTWTKRARIVRAYLYKYLNREFLTFLFFLALSALFWLLTALNESYEREVEVPIRLVDIPHNVVMTSDSTATIRLTVRDKGYTLATYLLGNRLRTIRSDFQRHCTGNGQGVVPSSELHKLLQQQLYNTTKIVSVKPDRFEFTYNYGQKRRVAVRLNGAVTPERNYYIARLLFQPDSVDIYASKELLDSIKSVATESVNIANLADTLTKQLRLLPIKGVRIEPEGTRLVVCPDVLTEETLEVPVRTVNVPRGKTLRTFPSKVSVTFTVGASLFRTIATDKFRLVADNNEIKDNGNDRSTLQLRSLPQGVRNARLAVRQVDYLIEEQ